jgi:hypothetical protein
MFLLLSILDEFIPRRLVRNGDSWLLIMGRKIFQGCDIQQSFLSLSIRSQNEEEGDIGANTNYSQTRILGQTQVFTLVSNKVTRTRRTKEGKQ